MKNQDDEKLTDTCIEDLRPMIEASYGFTFKKGELSHVRTFGDIQATRNGKQNIVEASTASGTSKEMEIKLTNVARASLEELRIG